MSCFKKPSFKLSTDGAINLSVGNELYLSRRDRDPVPTYTAFVRRCCYVVLCSISCLRVLKRSFDNSAKSDAVKRSPTTAKIFVSFPAGNRT